MPDTVVIRHMDHVNEVSHDRLQYHIRVYLIYQISDPDNRSGRDTARKTSDEEGRPVKDA